MPLFYLHVCNGNGFTEDTQGQEFDDLAAARTLAIQGLRDIVAADMRLGDLNMGSFIEIEDEHRDMVALVEFAEAVRVRTEKCEGRRERTD